MEEKINMEFSEKWGTDVETAVKLALDELKLTIDEVDVKVLEEPSRGFFGIGSKLALVRVEKKKPVEEPKEKQREKIISTALAEYLMTRGKSKKKNDKGVTEIEGILSIIGSLCSVVGFIIPLLNF